MERHITDQEKEKIVNFGAFRYSNDRIASILGWDVDEVNKLMDDESSEFCKLYHRGVDTADYVIDMKLFEMAQQGDLKALQKFEFRKKSRK